MIEGGDFLLDLSNVSDPFPPYITSLWTLNDQILSTDDTQYSSTITTGLYNITILRAARELMGEIFKLNVSNKVGFDSDSFSLDVQCKLYS